MTNYDRLYDMARRVAFWFRLNWYYFRMGISNEENQLKLYVRRPGFEPGCPKAPDPKSDATGASTPASETASATQRHQSPPKTSQTTTNSTTDSKMSVSRRPAPAWGRR